MNYGHNRIGVIRGSEFFLATCVIAAIEFAIQSALGTFASGFGDDDPSHFLSGLLVHDYIRAGFPHLIQYLKLYYSHYPLLGFGHWGPAWYAVEGIWMLLFPATHASLIVLAIVTTTLLTATLYFFCRRFTGPVEASFAALALVLAPMTQESGGAVMLDLPIALFCFLAMFAYVRYLDTSRIFYSLAFAFCAVMALLMKGTGGALVLLPPIAILISGRYELLRKASFWLPLPIVGALTGPWYWVSYGRVAVGFRYHWGIGYFDTATTQNFLILWHNLGPIILIATALGFVAAVWGAGSRSNYLIGAASLFAAVWVFQSVVPAAIQDRYLVPLLAPLLVLAVGGMDAVIAKVNTIRRFAAAGVPRANSLAAIVALASILPFVQDTRATPPSELADLARQVWAHRLPGNPSILIAAKNHDEGAAIAELAIDDPVRPSLFAIRGTRLLGAGGYDKSDYVPRFATAEQVMAAIDSYNIGMVLVRPDPTPDAWAHIAQIERARQLYPDRWQLIYRDSRAIPAISLYRIRGNAEKQADRAKLIALSSPNGLL